MENKGKEIKRCPLRLSDKEGRTDLTKWKCLYGQCAWYHKEDEQCAILSIAQGLDQLSGLEDAILALDNQ